MVTRDDVRYAYRLILGREPESEDAIEAKVKFHESLATLRGEFLGCPEFMATHPSLGAEVARGYWEDRGKIDITVPDDKLERMVGRVREQWTHLGEVDPYWSVLTAEEYRSNRLNDDRLEQFYETGRQAASVIDIFQRRTGVGVPTGICFELGCGVGRVTQVLARRFEKVIAADISPGNLAICQQYMKQKNITNVETFLIRDPSDISKIQRIDFFFSLIVLQHNPPPIQKYLLDTIFAKISRGGGALFQTPDSMPNYSFDADEFLNSPHALMDMHCLPKSAVFELLRKHDIPLRDMAMDNWTGAFGSYTYFAQR